MPAQEHAIVLTNLLLREAEENDGSLRDDAGDDEDGEHHDEDGAEGETELALVSRHVLEGLLHEEAEFLPA